jgi:hypothetical protein
VERHQLLQAIREGEHGCEGLKSAVRDCGPEGRHYFDLSQALDACPSTNFLQRSRPPDVQFARTAVS